MREAIKNFAKQFRYRPKIEGGKIKKYKKFVVAGMGGSHLAADILKTVKPDFDAIIWKDYGLPALSEKDWKKTLVIASSYSGNTEEAISAFEDAKKRQLPLVAYAIGGKLIEMAKRSEVPYVQMPDTGIQPRSALGYSLKALLKIVKENELLKQSANFAKTLKPLELETEGKNLAQKLQSHVPVIYASANNYSVAYNWKIKLNETGKIPAFYNVFPELNHNEINGMDAKDSSRHLSDKFYFVFLKDSEDHPQIQKRMVVTAKLYKERNLPVEIVELRGQTKLEKIFSSLVLADWIAYHTAEQYGLESEQVPMVEELKKLIADSKS